MAEEFAKKHVLITGGTKGLGFSCAVNFAKAGASLILLTYRSDRDQAEKAAEEIRSHGCRCETIQSDLSEEGASDALFNAVSSKTDHLDFYIHNAAATAFKDLLELKSHHIDKTLNITVKSFILNVQHAVELMKNGGAIVTVSGMDTLKAVPRHGLLGAAKSALETLTAYYAHELASRKIRVNGVNPGFFRTESTQKYLGPQFDVVSRKFAKLAPLQREPSLDEIAQTILFLCSERASWIVGQTIKVDGGADFALSL